jgi:hypothetical protein
MNKFLKPLSLLLLSVLLFTGNLFSQEKREYTTARIQGESPRIDGLLDDPAWEQLEWGNTFTQYQPLNGGDAALQTAFKILYDDNFLYVAIRSYDDNPEEIVNRMSRRDGFQGDWVEIAFDSYHDFSTAYSFTATVAGVKNDELYTNDGFGNDRTWDPIWLLKTSIDREGWVAEIKIPFTQLRFSEENEQVWGLQVKRFIHRKEERSLWQHIPNELAGYVSRFGELHGLKNIKPKKQFDLTPYAVASFESFEAEDGNPFTDGSDFGGRVGLDAKIGLTNNLTLDLTINPDFGQVEADPSQVNLSAFESYFREKRMFFIEGRNIYSFPLRLGGGNGANDNLFYSRRLGKRPSYYPDSYSYIDSPANTSILGAAKITGKTKNGLSIGILESVTNVEYGQIADASGNTQEYAAEPLTNYFVSRIEQDLNEGNTKIGGMFTATNRKIEDAHLNFLPTAAYSGGVNFDHAWNNRKYNFSIKLMGSHIKGDPSAISELQMASSRYYQRPDANNMEYDPNLRSLSGHAGNAWFGKLSNGGWSYIAWLSWQSPGFELNDIGFLRYADDIAEILWAQYNAPKPFSIFRRLSVEGSHSSSFDYSGKYLGMGGEISLRGQFTNFWSFGFGTNINTSSLEKTLLRGGPLFRNPSGINAFVHISTDRKKNFSTSGFISYFWGAENHKSRKNYSLTFTYRPMDQIRISLRPSLRFTNNQLQYIDMLNIEGQDNYFLAEIDQKTFVTQLRVDYSFTPDFSLQFYAQPFISTGEYSNFKYVTNPIADQYTDRFNIINPDADYGVDINNNGSTDGYLYDPDFKILQFQSNLVARWEYRPGSIVYLVWSQNKTDFPSTYAFDFTQDMEDMLSVFPHNIFLVKLSYRIPI